VHIRFACARGAHTLAAPGGRSTWSLDVAMTQHDVPGSVPLPAETQETGPYTIYTKRAVRPILQCMVASGILAVLCLFVAQLELVQRRLLVLLAVVVKLVPSIGTIASTTAAPISTEITLATQWLFAPIYVLLLFCFLAPWSPQMTRYLGERSRALTPVRRVFSLIFLICLMGAWLLGDLGLIGFPTFYNGKFLYPPSETAPQLALIAQSRIALAIYAWFSPIGEASILWALSAVVLNAKTCFLPSNWVSRNGTGNE